MANTISPNMGLTVPGVGTEPSPTWATDLNASLSNIDSHNHSSGQGVQINPSGININAQLAFNNNSAVSLASTTFSQQVSFGALNSIYVETDGNLYYNDGNGNTVKITSAGVVNATSSGISSGTATASFVADVLVVNANVLTPANIQAASILFGNNSSGTNYVTISPPPSTPTYSLVLPLVPGSTQILSIDSTGVIAANSGFTQALNPTGAIIAFGGASAPSGYLLCDGSAVSRTTFSGLFAILGTAYGAGDGSTTFNVPNTFGVFVRGAGAQTISGVTYSTSIGTVQQDEFQGHFHQGTLIFGGGQSRTNAAGTTSSSGETPGVAIADFSNGTPRVGLETRPVNVGVNYIIKT